MYSNEISPQMIAKFKSNYVVDASGCWLWKQYLNDSGYGRTTVNGIRERAHRASWILLRGEIPDGMFVCHKCDVRHCVNPDHLFLGTQIDNIRDCSAKGRNRKTAEMRQRISERMLGNTNGRALKGRHLSEEHREKLKCAGRLRVVSLETRSKMSDARKRFIEKSKERITSRSTDVLVARACTGVR